MVGGFHTADGRLRGYLPGYAAWESLWNSDHVSGRRDGCHPHRYYQRRIRGTVFPGEAPFRLCKGRKPAFCEDRAHLTRQLERQDDQGSEAPSRDDHRRHPARFRDRRPQRGCRAEIRRQTGPRRRGAQGRPSGQSEGDHPHEESRLERHGYPGSGHLQTDLYRDGAQG